MSKLENNSIYIPLQGRIGNQLFQYAYARMIQIEKGINTKIVIDDSDVLRCGWENSLMQYVVFLYTLFYFHLIINSCCSGSCFQPGGSFFRG